MVQSSGRAWPKGGWPRCLPKRPPPGEVPGGRIGQDEGQFVNPAVDPWAIQDVSAKNAPAIGDFLSELRIAGGVRRESRASDEAAQPHMIGRRELIIIPPIGVATA